MITEIYIEDRRVDISEDISSLLTFAIDDVKDFASRQTTFSKTVVLPGTSNNNALFGSIFETGQSNAYDSTLGNINYNFNASKSARCVLFQDNLQTFKGTMRMLEIVKDKQRIEYEVALNGELTTLNVLLTKGLLSDLDFSAYNIVYSAANIAASWNNPGGSGVYFPLIDYGNYSILKHDWKYSTFKPALYAKEYIDKMFLASSFRYDCALFNTPRFKSLIIPHNAKKLVKSASNIFDVSRTGPFGQDQTGTLRNNYLPIPFPTQSTLGNFSANVASTQFTYTSTDPLTATFNVHFTGSYTKARPDGFFVVTVLINSLEPDPRLIGNSAGGSTAGTFDVTLNPVVTLNQGDVLTVLYTYQGTGNFSINFDQISFTLSNGANSLVPIGLGEVIPINDTIPQNVRQIDLFSSIVKLFNLYAFEDRFDERLIHIAPFVDYYSTSSSNAVEWTYKLNRDEPIRIKPMSELNSKIYNFKYKEDSDFYNSEYKKRYNELYGSRVYDSQFEFASDTSNLELIFAPTVLVGYPGEDKVYSTIFKKSGNVEENIDSVIRILQSKKVTGVNSWDIQAADGSTINSYTDYGYAGHLDDPDNPDNDLNFGVLQELYFTLVTGNLTKNQFNLYWSSYMAEITDKDSKLLTAKFYLTPNDIFLLDFSKYIYVDGVLFRLNKITDYNVTVPSDCEVQLLKVINTIY